MAGVKDRKNFLRLPPKSKTLLKRMVVTGMLAQVFGLVSTKEALFVKAGTGRIILLATPSSSSSNRSASLLITKQKPSHEGFVLGAVLGNVSQLVAVLTAGSWGQ